MRGELMFGIFFMSMQQDWKLFLFPPLLCAVFRGIFLHMYNPYSSLNGQWSKLRACFRFGFWWGMDFNSYVFLVPLVLVTVPGLFFPFWNTAGDFIRLILVDIYCAILYAAFMGKLIFYFHFRDTYNHTLRLGLRADRSNLVDIFFHEHHGLWILLGYIPFLMLCTIAEMWLLSLPSFTYPTFSSAISSYVFNLVVVVAIGAAFYFFRYGGTFIHDNKPEWDNMPPIIKKDLFFARGAEDDLLALEQVWKHPLQDAYIHTDEEDLKIINHVIPPLAPEVKATLPNPTYAFKRTAQGAKIAPPQHIFLVVGESYSQLPLDDIYEVLHIADRGRKFKRNPHTAHLSNFLPGGMISRPAIVSLMSGIFDAGLELNEKDGFFAGTVPTSLPVQLKKLGYHTTYWYGGSATHGNFNQFAPACGFDRIMSATDFCSPSSPQSWLGVYDHIFLENAAEQIKKMHKKNVPEFHFLYTTSNHGPYKINLKEQGYDADKVMPSVSDDIKHNRSRQKSLGTHWYSDKALFDFVDDMLATYPDSLVIVTGDHAYRPGELANTSLIHRDYTIRETCCTSFMLYHREIDQTILAGNTIGGHMNIMPTILELIAPKDFTYYSLFPSLLEPIDHVVTPYHWMTRNNIGLYENDFYQPLTVSTEAIEEMEGPKPFVAEHDGWCNMTGYLVRHPELLARAEKLIGSMDKIPD